MEILVWPATIISCLFMILTFIWSFVCREDKAKSVDVDMLNQVQGQLEKVAFATHAVERQQAQIQDLISKSNLASAFTQKKQ